LALKIQRKKASKSTDVPATSIVPQQLMNECRSLLSQSLQKHLQTFIEESAIDKKCVALRKISKFNW
jgi:hypothetical protein